MTKKVLHGFFILPEFILRQEWSEKVHSTFPNYFKNSVFTFVACLKVVGFQKNKKIDKFVLFEIIKLVYVCFGFNHFIKELENNKIEFVKRKLSFKFVKKKEYFQRNNLFFLFF